MAASTTSLIYTRFYQGYVLPRKFGIDKRYGHLSDLINAGQSTREQALAEVITAPISGRTAAQDLAYVTKKLDLTAEQFERSWKRSGGRLPGLPQFLRARAVMRNR